MKKQILILVMFIVAIFAATNQSYAQCTTDALHPAANVDYTYSTTVGGAGFDGDGTYEWFVTTDPNIYNKTKQSPGTLFTWSGETTSTVTITWTAAAVELAKTTPIYVALWYKEVNETDGTCEVENVRALQIAPVNTFLLAVEAVDDSGAPDPYVCAAPVLTAVVDNPADVSAGEDNLDASMKITYDQNTLYYKITASGVDSKWKPVVRIPALAGSQTYASVQWSSDLSTWSDIAGATAATGGDYIITPDADATVAGTSYYVKLVINNNDYETLTEQVLNVAVDGTLAPGYTVKDIVSTSDCTDEVDFGKNADNTILPRPTITPGDPAFMLKVPAQ